MIEAVFFERYCGNDYYRDAHGNVYTKAGEEIAFCSNVKNEHLTEDKAEPFFPVKDVRLIGRKEIENEKN